MNTEELQTIAKKLEASPMFQLSLSSKELFHSNFLYWIWKCSPDAFKAVIGGLIGEKVDWPEGYVVKHEFNNYDVCALAPNGERLLVLENKVKSIPRLDQLEEYQSENKGFKPIYVLLSLSAEFPLKEVIRSKGWHIANYQELADALKDNR